MPDDCFSSCTFCPRVDSCCCCCSVRTGSIVIGFAFAICGTATAVFRGLNIQNGYYLTYYDFSISILMTITGILLLIGILKNMGVITKTSLILILVMIALYFVMCVLSIVEMAIDTHKDKWYRASGPFPYFLVSLGLMGILTYFFIVVLSHYVECY